MWGQTPILLGPLDKGNFNQWKTYVSMYSLVIRLLDDVQTPKTLFTGQPVSVCSSVIRIPDDGQNLKTSNTGQPMSVYFLYFTIPDDGQRQ
jgi:hypothetical protein